MNKILVKLLKKKLNELERTKESPDLANRIKDLLKIGEYS